MLRNIQGWQWVIIILAIVILIGWKRLPDAARSLGRSMRIFKSEVEQMSSDTKSAASSDTVDGEAKRDTGTAAGAAPAPADHDARGDEVNQADRNQDDHSHGQPTDEHRS